MPNRLMLAPMAGITDRPYRRVMARHGAGTVVTEMVSAEGLRRDQKKTWEMLRPDPGIGAVTAVQIFGSDPLAMAEAARAVEGAGYAMVDINAGCPVRKVARQGAGATLLKDPGALMRIVEAVRRAVRIPVTVKVRIGWDREHINIEEVVNRLGPAGADAVIIHARTATQMYGGQADWDWIARAVQAASVPVIGNGDVTSPEAAEALLARTGCGAVMVGRASRGNPWLMGAINKRIEGLADAPAPGWEQYLATVEEHVDGFLADRPKPAGHLRQLLVWYSRECPGSSRLRSALMEVNETGEMMELFRQWVDRLRQATPGFRKGKLFPDVLRV